MGGFIPLGDASRPPTRFAVVTLLIIVLNVWVFFQELTYGDRFVYIWSAVPNRIIHGHAWITILTSMFMHASWMHIIGNMIYLWAFGREIENAMGPIRFAIFYLIGGIVAMSAQILGDPFSRIPALGASGAIAAVMGAFLITFPRDRIRTLVFFLIFFRITLIPAALLIGFWFVMQVLNVGSVAQVRTGGVAYLAHIGGFLFGVVTAKLFISPQRMTYRRFS
ncbi:rhomboid family intramembrane serine protease [Telmatobacter sp. DSM 110680]|uniref:Rhomboid family intramembrane serine protease n=1 Tax=Telmatobacter sp. DSM 110680 TaxID=3036704 RepID=A0AAU7DI57_9BACT